MRGYIIIFGLISQLMMVLNVISVFFVCLKLKSVMKVFIGVLEVLCLAVFGICAMTI
jgi:hypothetical protein